MATKTALAFSTAGDQVSVPSSTTLDGQTVSTRTIEVWLKTGTDVSTTQVVFEEGGGGGGLNLYIASGSLLANAWNSTTTSLGNLSVAVSASTVYHAAYVFNQPSNASTLYIDGVSADTDVATGTVAAHTGGLVTLGNNNGVTRSAAMASIAANNGLRFGGLIGQLRVWNSVRTQSQVDTNKYADLTGSETGLVMAYNLNDGSGSSVNDVGALNLDGTITGATWSTFDYTGGDTDPPAAPTGLTATMIGA